MHFLVFVQNIQKAVGQNFIFCGKNYGYRYCNNNRNNRNNNPLFHGKNLLFFEIIMREDISRVK